MRLAFFSLDDTEIVRIILVRMLNRMGHIVVGQAADIEGAIAGCSTVNIDLLTCDLGVPRKIGEKPIRLGGYEVAESINKIKPGVGIIFISATDDQTVVEILEKSKTAGMTAAFVKKPFTEESLEKAINSVVKNLSQ